MNNPKSGRTLAIFDLCDTLYAANTTMGFLEFYERRTHRSGLAVARRRWLSRRSPAFYWGALVHRLWGRDIARERLVASLAGEKCSELTAAATDYAREALSSLTNDKVQAALARHREAGDRVMIMSSSLDLVVAPIAELLQVEFAASTLGFDDERCTGRIERDLTGRKAELADEQRQIEGGRLVIYTDNRSDLSLIDLADQAIVVLPKAGSARRWAGDGVEYVRL